MIYKYLEKLEFNQIREILKGFCKTYIAKSISENLEPFSNKNNIKKALKQTTEASTLLYRKGNLPLDAIENVIPALKKLKVSNALSTKELLDLAHILKISRELKDYYLAETIDMSKFINLENIFLKLYQNITIEKTIFSCILDEDNISDTASPTLASIRRNLKNKEQEIRNKLNSFLTTKYVQESIITIRQGRFVIPIKNEYRSEVKGFIHDISASGSTIFVEPISVFDLNNELSNLKNDEKIEIQKILMKLSSLFFEIIDNIQNNINLIGLIDFIFAKAKYSNSLGATEPVINNEKFINLKKAWHPLIDKNIAVRNDILLGKNYSNLIITGPNTGGKTVTLKTVGIICLMAMSGLHIPASEGSSIFIFDNVFTDIGDEQSIADSLSTFSSHLINISNILKNATSNSLVLLDELCSGTDPSEGALLAISILEDLNSKGILSISTTHYPELKHFALITKGFENSCVEFNIDTLTPTYKLLLGVPGTSNAFEISKNLGVPEKIIYRAKELLTSDKINIEDLLKSIYNDKKDIEREKEKILENSTEIEKLKEQLKKDYSTLEEESKNIINSAKLEARQILINAKEEANSLIKKIENSSNTKELNNIRKKIKTKIDNLNTNNKTYSVDKFEDNELLVGLEVFIPSINQNGKIISINNKDKKAQIQVGLVKLYFSFDDIAKPTTSSKKENTKKTYELHDFKVNSISSEINVIGQNVEEACHEIDKYLDLCYMNHLNTVRIIHGKGTGTLRKGIHLFLKNHPHVKSYYIETLGRGEMGVTVVEIK
ncbi:MAG: endonuclease MutS2 [Clostridia bacterium]|nr:endonuclease MutS2 [Clostridia bacterium]